MDHVTTDTVLQVLPALSAADSDRLTFWVDRCPDAFNLKIWGKQLQLGEVYYIAHNLAVEGSISDSVTADGLSGQVGSDDVTSFRAGDVQWSKAANLVEKQMDNPFMSTKWGQMYWQLLYLVTRGAVDVLV